MQITNKTFRILCLTIENFIKLTYGYLKLNNLNSKNYSIYLKMNHFKDFKNY